MAWKRPTASEGGKRESQTQRESRLGQHMPFIWSEVRRTWKDHEYGHISFGVAFRAASRESFPITGSEVGLEPASSLYPRPDYLPESILSTRNRKGSDICSSPRMALSPRSLPMLRKRMDTAIYAVLAGYIKLRARQLALKALQEER